MEEDIVKNSRVFRRFLSPYTDTEIQERKIPTEEMVLGIHRGATIDNSVLRILCPFEMYRLPQKGSPPFFKEFGKPCQKYRNRCGRGVWRRVVGIEQNGRENGKRGHGIYLCRAEIQPFNPK